MDSETPPFRESLKRRAKHFLGALAIRTPPMRFGMFLSVLGVLLIFLALWISAVFPSYAAIASSIKDVGVSLIPVGLIGIWFGAHDTLNYFRDRLKEVVLEQGYLLRLSDSELESIIRRTVATRYKSDAVYHRDGFLSYLVKRIFVFLQKPYKEDYHYDIIIEKDGASFLLTEIIRYRSRSVDGDVMPIDWAIPEREKESTRSISVALRLVKDAIECRETEFSGFDALSATREVRSSRVFYQLRVPIPQAMREDGLAVTIRHTYALNEIELLEYRWRHPTNRMTMTVKYPDNFAFLWQVFGADPNEYAVSERGGLFTFTLDTWMPPWGGFAFHFRDSDKSRTLGPREAAPVPR